MGKIGRSCYKGTNLALRKFWCEDLMYNMVAIVDDTVLYNLNFAKRVERRHFLKHTEKVNK